MLTLRQRRRLANILADHALIAQRKGVNPAALVWSLFILATLVLTAISVCCASSPSPSIHQPAPGAGGATNAVCAYAYWPTPVDHPTPSDRSGVLEPRFTNGRGPRAKRVVDRFRTGAGQYPGEVA